MVFRVRRQIDENIDIQRWVLRGASEQSFGTLLDAADFPTNKFPALSGIPFEGVFDPISKIPKKLDGKRGRPANSPVAGVGRAAVDQAHKRDLFSGSRQLLGHFVGHVAAETITAEVVRPLELDLPDLHDVMRGHLFDRAKFPRPVHAARFERIDRLICAKVAREIRISPEHAAPDAMDQKQGRPLSLRLNFDDRGGPAVSFVAAEHA